MTDELRDKIAAAVRSAAFSINMEHTIMIEDPWEATDDILAIPEVAAMRALWKVVHNTDVSEWDENVADAFQLLRQIGTEQ